MATTTKIGTAWTSEEEGQPGQVILDEVNPPRSRSRIRFRAWVTAAVVPTAGYGGWSKVARPLRRSLTEWQGRDPLSVEVPFLIDGLNHASGKAVDKEFRDLEKLAGLDGNNEPSLVWLKSNPDFLIPHGFEVAPKTKWFIEALSWSADTVITSREGRRLRIGGTMTLTQYVEDSRLEKLKRGKPHKGSGRLNWYRIKVGDTLPKIAARKDVYGDHRKWKLIAKANKVRDPSFGGGKDGAKKGSKWIGKRLRISDPPKKGGKD